MHLRNLELEEFRSFRHLSLAVEGPGFCAIGPNASGKSTLLEAIFMLATTRSPRTSSEREIANWDSGKELGLPPYARIRGVFERADGPHDVEIGLSVAERGIGSLKKQVRFDARAVRATDAVGQLKAVLFTPEDVALLSGSPSHRRRYLDIAISQSSRPYLRALSRYGRVLEQRNSLLRSFVRGRVSASSPRIEQELGFWNAELNIYAVEVLSHRLHWIDDLGHRAMQYFSELTGENTFALSYRSRLSATTNDEHRSGTNHFRSQQFRQLLSAAFANALSTSLSEELARGITVIGPHRDDFAVDLGQIDNPLSVLKVAPYATEGPIINGKNVTFTYSSYDYNKVLELSAMTDYVAVIGSFSNWQEIPLERQPNNTWAVTQTLEPGDYYYSFVVRDLSTSPNTEKRNDPLNTNLESNSVTGISRNKFHVSELLPNTVPVSSVSLNKGPTLDLVVGEQEYVRETVSPTNASNKNVNWTSSNPNIVNVDGSGKLTAISKGTAVIICTTVDGGKTAMITVTVNEQDNAVSYPRVGYKNFGSPTGVIANKVWKVKFNQALDRNSLVQDHIYILNESGIKVPLAYILQKDEKTLELRSGGWLQI